MRDRSPRRALPRALRTAVLLGLLGAAACHADSDASEPLTVAERRALVAADSAAGDAAAFAALPPALHVLRLQPYLTNEHIAGTEGAFCHIMEPPPGAGGGLGLPSARERRSIELPFPDSSLVVVGVHTDADLVSLENVEVHMYAKGRRLVDRRSFQWTADRDVAIEVRWPEELDGRQETATQPPGGPIPRAIRALGRLALQLDCIPEPPKPPDDSTILRLPATLDITAEVPRP